MSKKNIILVLSLAVVSGIILAASYVWKPSGGANTPAANVASVTTAVTVTIDDASGSPRTYRVENPNTATAFGVLQQAAQEGGFSLDFDPPGQYGVFVKGIAGKAGDDKNFWSCAVNGADCQVASDQLTVSNSDTVTWTYTPVENY